MSIYCGASFGGGQGYTDTCGKEEYGAGTPLAQCKQCMRLEIFNLKAENESLRKDADKWKIVEHAMESLKSDERNASIWSVCSRLLISTAHKLNSASSTVTEEGVTVGDVEIGDWRVTVERISSPENP